MKKVICHICGCKIRVLHNDTMEMHNDPHSESHEICNGSHQPHLYRKGELIRVKYNSDQLPFCRDRIGEILSLSKDGNFVTFLIPRLGVRGAFADQLDALTPLSGIGIP